MPYYDKDELLDYKRRRQEESLDGLAMALGMSKGCRKCPWFEETAECFFENDFQISIEQIDYLRMMCAGCKGKETGEADPDTEERLHKECAYLREWCNLLGLTEWKCLSCPNVYRVYGKYKDPDDEWKAIEDLCCNCKYFVGV